jgi:hypothetical protein
LALVSKVYGLRGQNCKARLGLQLMEIRESCTSFGLSPDDGKLREPIAASG